MRAGELRPGDRLPAQSKLKARYRTHAQTIQNAIDELKAEGLVETRPGAGVYVRATPQRVLLPRRRFVFRDERSYFFDAAAQNFWPVGTPAVTCVPAPVDIARRLGVEQGAEVVRRWRVLGDPDAGIGLQVAVSFLPAWLAKVLPIIASENPGLGGIYDRIEEWDGAPLSWEEAQGAIAATKDEADVLDGVVHGGPLVRIVRTATLQDGRPVEVNDTRMDGHRYEVVSALVRDVSAAWPVAPAVAPLRPEPK